MDAHAWGWVSVPLSVMLVDIASVLILRSAFVVTIRYYNVSN